MDYRPYTTPYHSGWEKKIKNIDSLPSGTGAKYLKCAIAHNGDLIAKEWKRHEPQPEYGFMVFSFKG